MVILKNIRMPNKCVYCRFEKMKEVKKFFSYNFSHYCSILSDRETDDVRWDGRLPDCPIANEYTIKLENNWQLVLIPNNFKNSFYYRIKTPEDYYLPEIYYDINNALNEFKKIKN